MELPSLWEGLKSPVPGYWLASLRACLLVSFHLRFTLKAVQKGYSSAWKSRDPQIRWGAFEEGLLEVSMGLFLGDPQITLRIIFIVQSKCLPSQKVGSSCVGLIGASARAQKAPKTPGPGYCSKKH